MAESARYNLGSERTTNLPNLPLELLHRRYRHRFLHRVDGVEKIRGVNTVRLVLEEQASPTIIRSLEYADMKSVVRAWIEESTGRLHRAEVRTRDPRLDGARFENVAWVDFKGNAALDLLVPSEMREQFFAAQSREGTSVAKYSNFRRFQTSGRIVPRD